MGLFNARQFVDLINKYGGDAKLIHLPEIGIKGNTHALFSDLNNKEILKITEGWLAEKGLDKNDAPHLAPKRNNPLENKSTTLINKLGAMTWKKLERL